MVDGLNNPIPPKEDGKKILKKDNLVKVKNTSGKTIFTSKGAIKEGKSGEVTFAEYSAHHKSFEKL